MRYRIGNRPELTKGKIPLGFSLMKNSEGGFWELGSVVVESGRVDLMTSVERTVERGVSDRKCVIGLPRKK